MNHHGSGRDRRHQATVRRPRLEAVTRSPPWSAIRPDYPSSTTTINPDEFVCSALATELADEWVELAATDDLSRRCNDQQRRMLNQAIFHGLYIDDDQVADHSLHEPFGRLHAVQQARQAEHNDESALEGDTEHEDTKTAAPQSGRPSANGWRRGPTSGRWFGPVF